jgi:Uncharacterized protein conserved in archaea
MSAVRDRIERRLAADPGLHFRGVARACDLATGQAQYHLRTLRRADRLVTERVDGRLHYFPPEYDAAERRRIAVLRRETAAAIVAQLLADGPTAPADVAAALDCARSTVAWHVDRLVDADLVRKDRDADGRVTLALNDRATAVRILSTVDPSLPETLVDRFERLVDDLLP